MCGICGFVARANGEGSEALEARARAMAAALLHRGPDAEGVFADPACGLALAHRRLSIIDLSPAGAQPMASADGRWLVAYNGEIYNFEALRAELDAGPTPPRWRGGSDTEVLIECVARWGIDAVAKLNGMFACAIVDRAQRMLHLVRDRLGEKPLYYGWQGDTFLFGSELKALLAHPRMRRTLDPAAVAGVLAYCYVPAPRSIFAGVHKLPPAHIASVALAPDAPREVHLRAYWSLPRPAPQPRPREELLEETGALLADAVRLRMRADVPMGAFLSGGIDSSLIVALMQAQSATPVRTFSIGFDAERFDESAHAARVAAHLGTRHEPMFVTPQDALDVIPLLPTMYDEPFADSSQIPTYLLARMTRRHVTVALSGDGGDEVFGGYARYFTFDALWPRLRRVPRRLRVLGAGALRSVPPAFWDGLARRATHPLLRNVNVRRIDTLARALDARDGQAFYQRLVSFWRPSDVLSPDVVRALPAGGVDIEGAHIERDFAEPIDGMCQLDLRTYLPDDILVKVDRATMATSLEGRIPFLDHRLIELSARLPLATKVQGGVGKRIVRDLLSQHVPDALVDRPKQGFAVPLDAWLRGPLRAWAEGLLFDRDTAVAAMLLRAPIERVWRQHLAGSDRSPLLWSVLMLQAWARTWQPT